MRHFIAAVFTIGTLATAAPEFVPIQERAQGHSLAGSNLLNDSLYSNPAASVFATTYTVDGIFAFPKSYAVSILDTRTSSVGGAAGYFREKFGDSETFRQGIKVGLGQKISENFGIGIAGKAVWGPYGERRATGDYATTEYKDMDVGLLWNSGNYQLGLVARNTLGGNQEMDQGREWAWGGRISYDQVLFLSGAAQTRSLTARPYQFGLGAEYVSPWYFSIKGGYRYQPDSHLGIWSTGISFLGPRMSVHYALEFLSLETAHTLGATLVF